jgi:hypothetical protein
MPYRLSFIVHAGRAVHAPLNAWFFANDPLHGYVELQMTADTAMRKTMCM